MDKKTKILLVFLVFSLFISITLTYNRTVVMDEFEVEYSEDVDSYEEDADVDYFLLDDRISELE